jgi:hypothetical protein
MHLFYAHGRHVKLWCSAFAVLAVSSCISNSGTNKPRPGTSLSPSRICDGTLDSSAAAALRRLAGEDRFDELTGTDKFLVSQTVKHLHDEYAKQGSCNVYRSSDDSGHPLFKIRFSAVQHHPSGPTERSLLYPFGVYARAGEFGTDLYFRCSTKAPNDAYTGDADYVNAAMYAPVDLLRGNHINDDRMTILNSVSKAVAKAAGCATEAALPAKVPAPKSD